MRRVLLLLAAVLAAVAATAPTALAGNDKVGVCHFAGQAGTVKFVGLVVPFVEPAGAQGHFTESGTPEAGHEEDILLLVQFGLNPDQKDVKDFCEAQNTTTTTTGGGDTTATTGGGDTTAAAAATTTGGGGAGGGGGGGSSSGSGELPFTGLPVLIPLLLGGALLAGGAALLRRGRQED